MRLSLSRHPETDTFGKAGTIERLLAAPLAHRGLHGGDVVENSRAAFKAAIAAGHGIELDVQLSRDGEAFVFHDHDLSRLTSGHGLISDRTSLELRSTLLLDSAETIPPLTEVLSLIAGRVPLLIEVKAPKGTNIPRLCDAVHKAVQLHCGPFGVISFNPGVLRWFRLHAPEVPRGLVISEENKAPLRGFLERFLSVLWAQPDFLAYDIRNLPSPFATRARKRGKPLFTWTVRTDTERMRAAAHADQIIYERLP